MKFARTHTVLVIIGLVSLFAVNSFAVEGVSPGAPDRLVSVGEVCPTFSWQEDDSSKLYQIVAYSLHTDEDPADSELTAEAEVLYSRVAAGATSWTPSAEQCFAPGGRYVWFVRSVTGLIDDQVIEAGEWSAGRYFSVPAGPSAQDVARAVEVLKQWEAANGGGSLMLSPTAVSVAVPVPDADSGAGGGKGHPKSVPTASAAIRGTNPETDVEAYGVVGTSASVWGAGVAAVNTEGGPDLVLDGSVDGMPDTRLSEWGIDRSDPTDQVFAVANNGGGAITFEVFGTLRGTDLECPGCVSPSDLANESVTSSAIEDDGITDVDIAPGAVGSVHIFDGSIQAQDLAVDAISGGAIVDGSITSDDLADGAVSRTKIATSAIGTLQIDDEAVTAEKISVGAVGPSQIALESIGESLLADEAVTNPKIAPGAVDASVLADAAVTGAKLADGAVDADSLRNNAVTAAKIADDAVTTAKILNGSVTMNDLADESVGSDQIESGGVKTDDIDFGAVGTGQIADGAVTAAKLESGAIGEGSLADGAVTNSKLAINSVTASRILDGSIVGADLSDGAVSATKLGSNSVTASHIVDGAVNSSELANWSVGATKIAGNAVTAGHIADNAVTSDEIENGSVTSADLDPDTGIYSAGADLYTFFVQSQVDPGETIEVTAACSSAYDLPLQGYCTSSDPDIIAYSMFPSDWSLSDSDPAAYNCEFKNHGATSGAAVAGIVCVLFQ